MTDIIITRFNKELEPVEILEQYTIKNIVKVMITKDGRYLISEPALSDSAKKLYNDIMQKILLQDTLESDEIDNSLDLLKIKIEDYARKLRQLDTYLDEKDVLDYYINRDNEGYGIIDALSDDDNIEDILVCNWKTPLGINHKNYSHFGNLTTNVTFTSEEHLSSFVNILSTKYGKNPPTDVKPHSSFVGINKHRFTITDKKTISPDGPSAIIRIPSKEQITIYHLLKQNMLTPLAAAYLWIQMDLKGFGLFVGETGDGKTTMLNAIITMAHPNWHYYLIEDVPDLVVNHRFVSRRSVSSDSSFYAIKGEFQYGVFDLLKLALRSKPDFVIVNEVLGSESKQLFPIAQSGCGCLSTFHASSANDVITKLQSSEFEVSREQTSSISYILHLSKVLFKGKSKRIIRTITEPVVQTQDYKKKMINIFEYDKKIGNLMPDRIDEVIKRSSTLDDAAITLGIDDLHKDLEKRVKILEKIISDDIDNQEDISKEISQYYRFY